MTPELIIQWEKVLQHVSKTFGLVEDVKDIVFLIGVQELGLGYANFSKDQKIDIMHIGICKLLSFYGYYEFEKRDAQGWPHWKVCQSLPNLTEVENELLLKQAIVAYFEE